VNLNIDGAVTLRCCKRVEKRGVTGFDRKVRRRSHPKLRTGSLERQGKKKGGHTYVQKRPLIKDKIKEKGVNKSQPKINGNRLPLPTTGVDVKQKKKWRRVV